MVPQYLKTYCGILQDATTVTLKASVHRMQPSAAACGQKSVLLYIAPSVANRKLPDAAAGGRPPTSISVLYLKTVCPRDLFKMDTEKLVGQVRNNFFMMWATMITKTC
jgi:hypothetical protein